MLKKSFQLHCILDSEIAYRLAGKKVTQHLYESWRI